MLGSALFPSEVARHGLCLGTDTAGALAELLGSGGVVIPAELDRAVEKRRLDVAAGRYCARAALRECAPELAELPIPIGPNREPMWPQGSLGSIAHTRGFALAAAARAGVVRAIGVDVERWLDDGAPTRVGPRLLVEGELQELAAQTGWSHARVLTLVFSAKETIFKCLFPEVQQYFDFHDARVHLIDLVHNRFVARLVHPIAHLPAGFQLCGRFEHTDEIIVTTLTRMSSDSGETGTFG